MPSIGHLHNVAILVTERSYGVSDARVATTSGHGARIGLPERFVPNLARASEEATDRVLWRLSFHISLIM